ncbi:MAG: acyl-CoA thioesterase [Pseudobacter sp.]|uniref:acyl-CoA thioesterase n=1 Tax=Pseudobacter sp. TaxID=2045420 RepID=UPI003F7F9CE6
MELKSFYIVRFPDCDPLAHLNNSRYLDYFLNAREDHLRENFNILITDWLKQGIGWVVRQHQIQYLRPAFYNEKICITSQIIALESSELMVELKMFDESESSLKAILWTTFTAVDPKTGKRKELTAEFNELAQKLGIAEVDVAAGITERVKALRSLA